jgi:hypothetical protein
MPRGEGALLVAKTWRNAGLVTQSTDAADRCHCRVMKAMTTVLRASSAVRLVPKPQLDGGYYSMLP